jgi:type II secretion system protein F
MPQFAYKAKATDGSIVTGVLQAESERNALDSLDRLGVFPLEIRPQDAEQMAAAQPRQVKRKIRPDDVAIFTRQLGDLLKAGVPINRALGTLAQQTANKELSETIGEISREVSAGKAFHEAFARYPTIFSHLYVSMVKAGETGGFLEDVLHRLAGFIEKDQELRSRVRAALAYPILLVTIGFCAVAFLMVYFIPKFSEIFRKMGGNLPAPTQIVMAISYFLRDYWFAFGAGLLALFATWKRVSETAAGRAAIDRVRLRFPLFGDIVKKNAISRFARTLGTLLKSGVPILSALQIAKESMGNVILMRDIDEASAGVKQGRSLAELLRKSRTFPVMVIDMIAVGEEGGNLDEVLVNIADTFDRQVDRAVKVFVTLFEPALLLVMACIVGFIVVSMLLPVFTLSSMVK